MKKEYYYIIILIILIVAIIGIVFFIGKGNNKNTIDNAINTNEIQDKADLNENNEIQNTISQKEESEDLNEIKSLQNQINSTANPNIYKIEQEYDGRKILQIKPEVQYAVDLAGIIKNGKPEENEINNLVKEAPQNNGVWISEQSREKFSELLKNNNIENFIISDTGYLQIEIPNNELANKINNMINSNKLYIINITGMAYERDYISGEITEYPFEDMDPYQIIEPYKNDNKVILEMTTNKMRRLNENEILDAITDY